MQKVRYFDGVRIKITNHQDMVLLHIAGDIVRYCFANTDATPETAYNIYTNKTQTVKDYLLDNGFDLFFYSNDDYMAAIKKLDWV